MLAADLIKKHEGLSLRPYRCPAGKLTIGYGRNIQDNGISREEADNLLHADIYETTQHLKGYSFWEKLSKSRQAALIDMHYNLGATRFNRFKKMLAALDAGDYRTAAGEMMDSMWAGQVGRRATFLSCIIKDGKHCD